jgi:Ca2+-binding EF-hand superfamily protein
MSMAISGTAGAGMAQAMSGASMRMPPSQKMANVFAKIDTSGSGTISKSQFEQSFQSLKMPPSFKAMGAEAIFAKLDPNGTGSVSKQDFVDGMTSLMAQARQGSSHASHSASQAGSTPAQTLTYSLKSLEALGKPSTSVSGQLINTSA